MYKAIHREPLAGRERELRTVPTADKAKQHKTTKFERQTWRVLREADPDLVETVLERADHLRDPRVPPLEHPQVRYGCHALRTALVLPQALRCATPAQGVVARQHHGVFEDARNLGEVGHEQQSS